MRIKLFLNTAICLFLSNATFANDADLCNSKLQSGSYKAAKPYCEKACNQKYKAGCSAIGALYYVNGNFKQAKPYFEKACKLGASEGCNLLGTMYYEGQGVRQNKRKAKEYFGQACDLGDQLNCDIYRRLNEEGY